MRKLSIFFLILIALIFTACNPYEDETSQISPLEDICIGAIVNHYDDFAELDRIGVKLARAEPGPFVWQNVERVEGVYDWEGTDKWVQEAQRNGVQLLVTIYPYNEWDQLSCNEGFLCSVGAQDGLLKGSKEAGFTIPEYRCAPCSAGAHRTFVKNMVERYDGDGKDDMEGLIMPIKYYEIGNKPELRGKSVTFFKGTSSNYFTMLKEGYEGVKLACDDCKVLHGGAAGITETKDYWETVLFEGGADYFDIGNIQYNDEGDINTLNVIDFREILNNNGVEKDIWVTQADISSEDNPQKILSSAFVAGASKVFFADYNTAKSVNLNSCLS